MNSFYKFCRFLVVTSTIIYVSSSCLFLGDVIHVVKFKNCTNDTLLVCASHHDCIDSVALLLSSLYGFDNDILDSTGIFLWDRTAVKDYDLIYPDSICATTAEALFSNQDTCYFFLVRWNDAKNYSWDGIRAKKLYKKWITIKNKDGDCDRNIRYETSRD
jgi:hypothetical protein